ncbi:MAG: glycosyltransferase family 4 protein [Rickettsiales bacterium]|jgi:glycosyltransferase involved in cell wall biosynthesis|nr:glycosyltransferase family 4 protein [Rickettsiales bacterium]
MNILHIAINNPNAPTGGLGVALHHITAFQAKEVRIHILCFDESNEDGGRFDDGRNIICAKITDSNFKGVDMAYQKTIWQAMSLELCKHLRSEKFDIIHLHDSWLWPVAEQARAMFNCPIVYTHHLSFLSENIGWQGWNRVSSQEAMLEAAVIRECYQTFVSHAYAQRINKLFSLDSLMPHRPCAIIANGVDVQAIGEQPAVDLSGLVSGRKPVYFCGRLVESKGLKLILEAARRLPNYHFLIFSTISNDHKDYTPLSREMKSAQYVLDNITWFNDFPMCKQFGYLKSSTLALVPSINFAPFEITALEAMAAKVPLITTGICGLSDYCHAGNSDLCQPTAESLVEAIVKHQRSEQKIKNAYATAQYYNWARAANDYLAFYRRIHAEHHLPTQYAA